MQFYITFIKLKKKITVIDGDFIDAKLESSFDIKLANFYLLEFEDWVSNDNVKEISDRVKLLVKLKVSI